MADERTLPRTAYFYAYTVIAVGSIVIAHSALTLALTAVSKQWLVLAALTLLTGSFSVKVPSVAARISVSEAFVFASVLLFGPAAATIIVALDTFVMSLWLKPHRRSRLRSAFNCSAVALAIWVSAKTFFLLAGTSPDHFEQLLPIESHLWELFALASLYFLLNSALVAAALSFERRVNPVRLWWQIFPSLSLNYFGGVSAAALLVSYTKSVDIGSISMILPLLLISYLTYRTSLGRIDDARRHVEQVHELYISTVETLAMAVDAKDQITHGHIRRVQVYATELARRLGVMDDQGLKAIEAAALLHDMGKLAIPEHILNKPGKLTAGEFDKMKQHADLGADLLSSIRFPYPVVPIVRHHHENWDGRGYPTGISGTDIPLGARILSVVDCFDALTSDRPYRARMTPAEAFAILRERRGTMYDPLVVDTFIDAYPAIASAAFDAGETARSLVSSSVTQKPFADDLVPVAFDTHSDGPNPPSPQRIPGAESTSRELIRMTQALQALMPVTTCAFFRYDRRVDTLICEAVAGDDRGALRGLRIDIGERVTGWVASTRRSVVNADAMLDLAGHQPDPDALMATVMCVPLVNKGDLLGVLSCYSTEHEPFTLHHVTVLESMAALLAIHAASTVVADLSVLTKAS